MENIKKRKHLVVPRRNKLLTTKQMLQKVLVENHSRKGITLQGIYKCIQNKYLPHITSHRKSLIKNYLRELIKANILMNVTGKGLVGHLRLKNLKQFKKRIPSIVVRTENATLRNQRYDSNTNIPILGIQENDNNNDNNNVIEQTASVSSTRPHSEEFQLNEKERQNEVSIYATPTQFASQKTPTALVDYIAEPPAPKRKQHSNLSRRCETPLSTLPTEDP